MMAVIDSFQLDPSSIQTLQANPARSISSRQFNTNCNIEIALPNFDTQVNSYYQPEISNTNHIPSFYNSNNFEHLGLKVSFEQAVEFPAYDDDLEIQGNIKSLIKKFGVVTFENVFLSAKQRDEGHRNRFPHLHFHRDRNEFQPTPYSLFVRNPFDETQQHPRLSSTLFTSYKVIYLQLLRENINPIKDDEEVTRSHFDVFKTLDQEHGLTKEFNEIILEHPWTAPKGTGELTMMDNRTLLHASYYRHAELGYRIGVRYLK